MDLTFELLEHFRHDKVAELVLDVHTTLLDDLLNNLFLVTELFGTLDELLHDTEALLVSGQLLEVLEDGVENVLTSLFTERLYNLLDHVLALVVA